VILGSPFDEEEPLSTIIEPTGSDWEKVTIRNTGTAECLVGINFLMPQVVGNHPGLGLASAELLA
jgi:hypothetical protein